MKKFIFWGAIGVAAAIVIYMIWKSQNKDTPPAITTNPNTGGSGNATTPTGYATGLTLGFTPPALDYNKVLKLGVRGREVLVLQRVLNAITPSLPSPAPKIAEDGNFGYQTQGRLAVVANANEITLADIRARGFGSFLNIANSYQ